MAKWGPAQCVTCSERSPICSAAVRRVAAVDLRDRKRDEEKTNGGPCAVGIMQHKGLWHTPGHAMR
jgi:hypothetical protein